MIEAAVELGIGRVRIALDYVTEKVDTFWGEDVDSLWRTAVVQDVSGIDGRANARFDLLNFL